jgi:bifunctional enzyme CysN/CysC
MEAAATDITTFLAQQEKKELLRFLTAGNVDDGKSTLIGRLLYDTQLIYEDQLAAVKRDSERMGTTGGEIDLALLMDGLKAEREQGITIDVAYRYFSTSKRKFIIADCPGHEQYTRNMATGASNCDLAIILIDARHGVQQQTRRHSFIVSLLGIRHVVVAINKMDLVGWSEEVFERIKREYVEFATRLDMNDLRVVPISALKGDNIVEPSTNAPWYQGETLLHLLETVHIASDRNLIDLRFPVQYVNRPNLDFRGFSGTVASGVIRQGDEIMVLPSNQRSRVASIVTYDGAVPEAFPPMAVTVVLDDEIDVSRGSLLVHPHNVPRVDRTFDAMLVWMAEEPMAPGKQYFVKQATNLVAGAISRLHYKVDVNTLHREAAEGLAMNEVGRCTVTLSRPVAVDPYRHHRTMGAFIVVDRLTNRTVGAGMVLDRRSAGDAPSAGIEARVSAEERMRRLGQPASEVVLIGEHAATVAVEIERRLFDAGLLPVFVEGPGGDEVVRALVNAGLVVLRAGGLKPGPEPTASPGWPVLTLKADPAQAPALASAIVAWLEAR